MTDGDPHHHSAARLPGAPAETALTDLIRVIPERGLRQNLRATGIVWRRELIRFRTDRLRMRSRR